MVLAVTPGLTYVGMSGYSLQSRSGANAVTDDSPVGAGPRPLGAIVNMDIAVPHGAAIKEFYLSGTGATTVLLRRQIFGSYGHLTVASATTPAGVGLQEIKVAIDPPFVHDAGVESLLFRADLSNTQAVSSLAIGFVPASLTFVPLPSPKRVFDSRATEQPPVGTKGVLLAGQERVVDVTLNSSGVPATARAVTGNATITNTIGAGWIDVRPDGTAYAGTSTTNFTASGQTVANAFTATLGPAAKLVVRCGPAPSAAQTDFVIDIVGYYV